MHGASKQAKRKKEEEEEENACTYRKASHDGGVVLQLWVGFAVCCSSVRTSRRSSFKSWLFMEDEMGDFQKLLVIMEESVGLNKEGEVYNIILYCILFKSAFIYCV